MLPAIDLLRHGDTGFSGFRGRLDDPLTPLGWQQMEQAVAGQTWDFVTSSPRQRCAEFAQKFAAHHAIPLELDEKLAEMDFGMWEGKTAAELMQTDADALGAFWQNPEHHSPPGGESMAAFSARVLQAWDELCKRHTRQRVLVITHGGVIRRIQCHVRHLPLAQLLSLEVPHASLHKISGIRKEIAA